MANDNMKIYNASRTVPDEALKPINGGRLKGMSDINPMWRIKCLTEQFGPCGFGWKYEITRQWTEQGAGDEISAFCNINLYVKWNGEWSEAIPGTGGSAYVAKEFKGLYTSDECFKMALTDAISIACKALGFAADVYYAKDRTKYTLQEEGSQPSAQTAVEKAKAAGVQTEEVKEYKCFGCGSPFIDYTSKDGKFFTAAQMFHISEGNNVDGKARCPKCMIAAGTKKQKG